VDIWRTNLLCLSCSYVTTTWHNLGMPRKLLTSSSYISRLTAYLTNVYYISWNNMELAGPCWIKWFRNFLTNRSQRVVVRGSVSSWTKITSGVPQRTILGQILFLIYINDFSNNVSISAKLFADDTKVYHELTVLESDMQTLQSDLDRITQWTNSWQLNFKPDKCEVMRISHRKDLSLP
jgi:hypothetical protein